ncbi:AsmA family protein [Halpernia frigidisoli]|uniref:AsmA-like C-terminal region n=1 Tax=Halpernia frigidisoli TaxID=1125876 RepID=A0A1I3EAT1_9FLAO|nr:AsmA-like C-terminal region-containing protein [Halpernia frigidisoli]SFH95811.1 AsmA-like C-terminal region [Halpernia frigidisoli]
MNKFLKYFLRILGILIVLLLAFNAILYFYINSHKQELLQKFSKNISEKLNGDFKIGDLKYQFSGNITQCAVSLDNLSLKDSLFVQHHIETLKVGNLTAALDLKALLAKNIKIKNLNLEDGEFNLFTLSNSYSNSYLLNPKKDKVQDKKKSEGFDLKFDKISFSNFSVHIFNQIKGNNYQAKINALKADLDPSSNQIVIDTKMDLSVKQLLFNKKNGAFLQNASLVSSPKLIYDKETKKLSWDATNFKIKNQNFDLGGYFNLGKVFTFQLNIINEKTDFATSSSLLANNIQKAVSKYKVDGDFYLKANIKGLPNQETYVRLDYKMEENDVILPWFSPKNTKLTGHFLNQVDPKLACTDENSELFFQNITTEIQGIKVISPYVKISNIDTVKISLKAGAEGQSTELNQVLKNNKLALGNGTFKLDFKMNGYLQKDLAAPDLDGYIEINDTDLLLTKTKKEKIINSGKMIFKGQDLILQNIKSTYQKTIFGVNGSIKNVVPFLLYNTNNYALDLKLNSNTIKIDDFIQFINYLSNPNAKKTANNSKKLILDNINKNYQRISIDFKDIIYKKLRAQNLKANLILEYPRLRCDNLSVNFAGGTIKSNSDILNVSDNRFAINTDINVANVDFQTLLTSFDYFGINSLKTSQLKGRADLKTKMAFFINSEAAISPNSLDGNLYFNIKNGNFHNFVPLGDALSLIISKKRFADVAFRSITNNVKIKNGNITIPRMEVQTSALNFYLDGVYSFGNQTDMMISVPFSELRKRDPSKVPAKISFDEAGRKIFLKIKDDASGKSTFKVYTNQENAENNAKMDQTSVKENTPKSKNKSGILKIFRKK